MANDQGPLQWLFSVVDKMSAPLRSIEKAMGAMGKEAKNAEGHVGTFEKQIGKLEKQIQAIKSDPGGFKHLQKLKKELREIQETGGSRWGKFRHNLFESLEIAHRIGEAFHWMGEKIFEVGERVFEFGKEIILAAANEEKLGLQFELVMGNKREADELSEALERVGRSAYMSTDNLKQMELTLLRAGYRGKQLEQVAAAAQDIGAMTGGTAESAMGAAQMLATMQLRRHLDQKEIKQISAQTGISVPTFEAAIAKQLGTSVKGAQDLIKEGKVEGTRALQIIYDALIKQGGGPLGTMAKKMGQTLDARLTRLKELPERLMEGWAKSPGFQRFSDSIQRILDRLDPSTAEGQGIIKSITDFADQIGNSMESLTKGGTIDRLVSGLKDAVKVAEAFATALEKTIHAIATIIAFRDEQDRAEKHEAMALAATQKIMKAYHIEHLDVPLEQQPERVRGAYKLGIINAEEARSLGFVPSAAATAEHDVRQRDADRAAKREQLQVIFNGGINVGLPGGSEADVRLQSEIAAQVIQGEISKYFDLLATQSGVH